MNRSNPQKRGVSNLLALLAYAACASKELAAQVDWKRDWEQTLAEAILGVVEGLEMTGPGELSSRTKREILTQLNHCRAA